MDILRQYGVLFIIAGVILIVLGLMVIFVDFHGFEGILPGDIHITRKNFSFHFPLATCLFISLILTAVFYILRNFFSSR
ncbi:MAG: DUF2905 domain-containing protein [Candidatus Auribacterota bacterium]|jgi:hypothetical protein|nr:DUF2905 domain-containing protein [Candidatus Auribacterota bacterium]